MLWFIADADDPENCFVYFLRHHGGAIKIGRSADPRRRIREHYGNFGIADVLLVYHSDQLEEKRLHWRFKADHLLREWFRPSEAILGYIASFDRNVPRYQNGAAWHPSGQYVRGDFLRLRDIDERPRGPQPSMGQLWRLLSKAALPYIHERDDRRERG